MNVVMVVYTAIPRASPWYMMTCSVPVILTGGSASLLTVFLAYLTDVTTENDRGFRLVVTFKWGHIQCCQISEWECLKL